MLHVQAGLFTSDSVVAQGGRSAPDSSAGRFALGSALFQSGQFEAAIPELKVSLQLEPRLKQAYFLLGRAYSKLGRKDEANAALSRNSMN